MGGNLFKLGRLPRAQYLALEARLRVDFDRLFGEHYRIPRAYGDKADFGDMDVLVSEAALGPRGEGRAGVEAAWAALRGRIEEALRPTGVHLKGALFSTATQGFQVDFFLKPEAEFLTTHHFMSYNDLGNILGRLFRHFNLKYGERGLEYVYRRRSGHYRRDLLVSTDMTRILSFIMLDAGPWEAGFDDLESLFAWVTRSPWFSTEPYRDPGRNTRRRAAHRPGMARFVRWLDETGLVRRPTVPEDKRVYIPMIHAHFPEADLRAQLAQEQRLEARARAVQARFSGRRVMSLLPELSGQALGDFIKAFKGSFEDFEGELVEMSVGDVEARILDFAGERGLR